MVLPKPYIDCRHTGVFSQPNFFKKVEIRGCAVGSFPVIYIERATKYVTRSLGSAGEHRLHTAGVTGSNPVATTTNDKAGIKWFRPFSFKRVQQAACRRCRMLQMRRSRLFAELRTYFESGRGCFAKASTVVIMRACSSTVEQGTHNPLVLGSNPGGPTKTFKAGSSVLLAFSFAFYYREATRSLAASYACIIRTVGCAFAISSPGHHRNPAVRAIMGAMKMQPDIKAAFSLLCLCAVSFTLPTNV